MTVLDSKTILAGLLRTAALDHSSLNDVSLSGSEPVLPSSFATGTAAQATVAASALAAAELWRLRTGKRQHVSVDMRHAAIEFRSERYLQIDGKPYEEYHDDIAGLYRCGDGRWVRLHTNLPHHCSGLLALLQCPHDKAAVQHALDGWQVRPWRPPPPKPASSSPHAGRSTNGTSIRKAARSKTCRCLASSGSATRRPAANRARSTIFPGRYRRPAGTATADAPR